jgi:hypothetical protein
MKMTQYGRIVRAISSNQLALIVYRAYHHKRRNIVNKYVIMAEVDQKWLDILDQITRNQEGFIWIEVKEAQDE